MENEIEEKSEKNKKSTFKNPLVLGVVFLILLGAGYGVVSSGIVNFSGLWNNDISSGEFVALVNGEGIEKRLFDLRFEQTKSEYQAQGIIFEGDDEAEFRQQVLVGVIDERLLIQYGKEQGITANQQVVEEQYQQILSQFASEEQFEKQLASQNITLQDIQDSITEQIILQELVNQQIVENNIEVSEEEMQQAYDDALANGADIPEFEEVKLEIEEFLLQQKIGELMSALINQLRAEGVVETLS